MAAHPLKAWETLSTRELVSTSWVKLLIQQVRLPDGRVINDYYQVRFRDYAGVVAQTPDGRIIFERQYKHGVGRASLMLPGGAMEADEAPLATAQRELLEETGYVADGWQFLGSFVSDANQGGSKAHLFSAKNAWQVKRPDAGDLEDIDILLMKPDEITQAIQRGDIVVLGVVAALALALRDGWKSDN